MVARAFVAAVCLLVLGLVASPRLCRQPEEAPPALPAAPRLAAPSSPGVAAGSPAEQAIAEIVPGRLEGIVLDASREPVAGAIVRIAGDPPELFDPVTVAADASGRFHADALPAGQVRLVATAAAEFSQSITLGLPLAEPIEIVLPERAILWGRVVLEAGAPLGGVTVRASDGSDTWETQTGPDGAYELAVPSRPLCWIEASPLNRRTLRHPPEPALWLYVYEDTGPCADWRISPRQEVDFTFPEGASLRGLVLEPDGSPAVGAAVRLEPLTGTPGGFLTVATDAGGRFLFEGLAPGSYLPGAESERAADPGGAVHLPPGGQRLSIPASRVAAEGPLDFRQSNADDPVMKSAPLEKIEQVLERQGAASPGSPPSPRAEILAVARHHRGQCLRSSPR